MKPQQDLIDFSLSKTISIARPSAQIHLVDRIFETSNDFFFSRVIFLTSNNTTIYVRFPLGVLLTVRPSVSPTGHPSAVPTKDSSTDEEKR